MTVRTVNFLGQDVSYEADHDIDRAFASAASAVEQAQEALNRELTDARDRAQSAMDKVVRGQGLHDSPLYGDETRVAKAAAEFEVHARYARVLANLAGIQLP